MKDRPNEHIKTGASGKRSATSGANPPQEGTERNVRLEKTADKFEEMVIPIIEERARVSKKLVEKGNIYLNKEVHEEQVMVDLSLTEEEVEIERVSINEYIDEAPPAVRYEGDTMIVPVLKEVVVKRLVLVEEMRLTKKRKQSKESHPLTLRSEEVHVRRDSDKTSTPKGSENQA